MNKGKAQAMALDCQSSVSQRSMAACAAADAVGSILSLVDRIHWAIAAAKHNKTYVIQFRDIVKKIVKVLNGADSKFIRQAEFYCDLKQTLQKIEHHIKECSTRGKLINKLMGKKDQKCFEEFEEHIDHLITRIVFSFAQRVQLMNLARKKARAIKDRASQYSSNIEPILEVEEENEDGGPCSLATVESFSSLFEGDGQEISGER